MNSDPVGVYFSWILMRFCYCRQSTQRFRGNSGAQRHMESLSLEPTLVDTFQNLPSSTLSRPPAYHPLSHLPIWNSSAPYPFRASTVAGTAATTPVVDTPTHLVTTCSWYRSKYSTGKLNDIYKFVRGLYVGRNIKGIVDLWCELPVPRAWKELVDLAIMGSRPLTSESDS
ncbi:hypothetical protein EDC04DRAFT_2763581 [Pisolithus marmoratus]|nr:hypothetical protein EDC04DRAFT_2763581 [Pisolithus marmoratus]